MAALATERMSAAYRATDGKTMNQRSVSMQISNVGTDLPLPSWSSTMSTRPTSPVPSCFSRRNCDSARRPFFCSAFFSASHCFSCSNHANSCHIVCQTRQPWQKRRAQRYAEPEMS